MAKKAGNGGDRRYCECGAELGRGDGKRCLSCRYHDGDPAAVEQALAEQRADKAMPPEDKNGRPIRVGDKVVVYGQEGVVIRIQPGGYPVVQVDRHANAWQPDEVEVKSMAAACRVCGLRPAQDDGLCHDPKCPSYEARVKELRAKYKSFASGDAAVLTERVWGRNSDQWLEAGTEVLVTKAGIGGAAGRFQVTGRGPNGKTSLAVVFGRQLRPA